MDRKKSFVIAHISDDINNELKQLEEEIEQKLGKRIALVAYEDVEQ
ncbi:hypothetical protein [Ectobacillus polymachus]